jgi:murein tripeptide amidase MpaA
VVGGLMAAALGTGAPAYAASGDLDAYRVEATGPNLRALAEAGFDVTEGGDRSSGSIEVVGTAAQLRATKVEAELVVDDRGLSAADRSRRETPAAGRRARAATDGASDAAFKVWTKYDAVAGDGKEQYTEQYDRVVRENPGLVARRATGTTYEGREIVALQVTKGATGSDIPGRPAVLYNAMQHAREWLAGETCRRTLDYVLEHYGKTTSAGQEITPLVDNNELWFVCVNNPDGYEFTFTAGNRLWRKNLRDNDNNGVIKPGDGVDPNRNFPSNWGLDDEGSSPNPASETYRGPSPASEPETKAMEVLFDEIKPVFQKNDHTAAELLLYPQGFQQDTPTADHEIFTALAGDPFRPAIDGFLPELAAGLYITNGDFTDWAYNVKKTLSYTPEGTEAEDPNVTGFEYADSELQIEQEFQRHLDFALDLAKSADDPTEPDSHLGNRAEDFVVDEFPLSYGDPQVVQATLKRKLGPAELRFRVNGGPTLKVPTEEWAGGERYYKNDAVYYHRVRGVISGTNPGDRVEAWFAAGGKESKHFSYSHAAGLKADAPVLLLSNEDWSGKQPNPAPLAGPQYLETYKGLLDAAGIAYDVYDVDAAGRTAPHNLGVLSHYSHVVWYTGDDYVPRSPTAPGGSGIAKVAVDTQNRVRDFLNEGGKLFFTGQNAGQVFAEGYKYNPFEVEERGQTCEAGGSEQCIAVQDDFLQYWLGAHTYISGGGDDPSGDPLPVRGAGGVFDSGPFGVDPASHTATFLVTSSIYDAERYPQWAGSRRAMEWVRPGGSPFDPYTGDWFLSAGTDDESYKRLSRTVDLTGRADGTLRLRTSYDLEANYDYLFVEIRSAGGTDWTTLKERNGLNSQATGQSCPSVSPASNWQSLHPFLARYQTKNADGSACTPSGTSGEWWAATGNSGGWKQWELDIPAAYLGKQVEIAITVATDPASQGLGTWIDDTSLTAGGQELFATSFEDGDGGWTRPGPPAGTESQATGWTREQSASFVEGAAVTTPDTVYTGFGLEKLNPAEGRVAVLRDAFEHLGAPRKPRAAATAPQLADPPVDAAPVPGPPATTPPPARPRQRPNGLGLFRIGAQRLRTALRQGVRFSARCNGGCPLEVQVRVDRPTQRRLKLRSVIVGRRTLRLRSSRTTAIRVPFARAARTRLRREKALRVILVAVVPGAREGAGGRVIASSRLR